MSRVAAVPERLRVLVERDRATPIEQPVVDVQPERWSKRLREHQDVVRALPRHLDRGTVRTFALGCSDDPPGAVAAFIVSQIWGYGTTGYGPFRLAEALAHPELPAALEVARSSLKSRQPVEAFRALCVDHQIPWTGTSFGTKYLYFTDPHRRALILDRFVSDWLATHAGVSLRGQRDERTYAMWLTLAEHWAHDLAVAPDRLEMIIFSDSLGTRSSWRPRQALETGSTPAARERVTCAGAIARVLADSGQPMRAAEIADEINRRGLYQRRDREPLPAYQVSSIAHANRQRFRIANGSIALIEGSRSATRRDDADFEARRAELLTAVVDGLEGALPAGAPARVSAGRMIWDVLADHLRVEDARAALRSLARGPGGELNPSARGNVPMCSAESSALMAVNFLAPFASRDGLLGRPAGALRFERELRVAGVRAPVGPTLDAVHESPAGTAAFEAKTAEPWRGAPHVEISAQYDEPARLVSPKTLQTLRALRDGSLVYRCLDAAQLVKHLLGLHSALSTSSLPAPATLVVLYWRPSDPAGHAELFDLLDREIADFAARADDQPVKIIGLSTDRLLADWARPGNPEWLREHAAGLAARYDVPLRSAEATTHGPGTFGEWSHRWLELARYTGREVPELERRVQDVCSLWQADIPPGWERSLDSRLIDPRRRYLRTHAGGHPRAGSEHALEQEILGPDPAEVPTYCFGGRLVDGINAIPLSRDEGGARANNVEADMLLLFEDGTGHRLLLVEAKTASNNAFFAAIENLRQLRLFSASQSARQIFERRHPELRHPLPVTGVVLGPRSFLEHRGARERAVEPAQRLLDTVKAAFDVDARLATWDPTTRTISAWPPAESSHDLSPDAHRSATRTDRPGRSPTPTKRRTTATAFAVPEGSAIELQLAPRLESWERHDHPAQIALREFVGHVRQRIDPLIEATPGPLAFRLDVGVPEHLDPLWERDLDNYLFPIARELPDRVVSVWGTKSRGPSSSVRLEPAVPVTVASAWQELRVPRSPGREPSWKLAVRNAVAEAAELPEGPVAVQLAVTLGPGSTWPSIWKPSIDGLEPLLGRTYPDREWNPLDGRIVRLGLHLNVDASYGQDASMIVWARTADEQWPELQWLAALDAAEREAFFDQHRAKLRGRAARASLARTARPVAPAPRPPADEHGAVNLAHFQDDDPGYLGWLATHPSGYVINIQRSLNPSDARLHRAGCRWISGTSARGGPWTGAYIKLCSIDLRDLDAWALAHVGTSITRCRTCGPPRTSAAPTG